MKMKLSVDSYKIMQDNPSFMLLEMHIVSNGVNKHGTEFLASDIEKTIPKLANVPLNCIIKYGDFGDHARTKEEEKIQLGAGVVPETNKARMELIDGKRFLVANAIVWKYLYPEATAILKRRGKVDISMEITPLAVETLVSGIKIIKDWTYEAITLLGSYVKPAIEGAKATVFKYSNNEQYFESVMVKYGLLCDEIIVPEKITSQFSNVLLQTNVSTELLTFAKNIVDKNKYTYEEIVELNTNLTKMDKKCIGEFDYSLSENWFSEVIKEKEGGSEVNIVKDTLVANLDENKKYAFHDDTKLFYFDLENAKYKSVDYSIEEVEEVASVKFGEEVEVFKLEGADEFVSEIGEGQIVEDAMTYSIKKYAELILKIKTVEEEKLALQTSFSAETEKKQALEVELGAEKIKLSELSEEKKELEEKVLGFSALEDEIVGLRDYKFSKEKELKTNAVNVLYSKYGDFLSKEEVATLNEKLESMDISTFAKEVYSVVLPKIEAKIELFSKKEPNEGKSGDNLIYTAIPKGTELQPNTNESESLLSKLERI